MEYKDQVQEFLKKRMIDEISAATFYLDAAELIQDLELSEEIKDHAQEEFEHFKELVSYARNHGLKVVYDFDRSVIKNVPPKEKALINIIQTLERRAISNYRDMMKIARENDDFELEDLCKRLMLKEMEHFDDVALKTGDKRKIGESFKKFKKFRDKFKSF